MKQDFSIFKNIPNLVYLDSAATSQKPQVVLDAISDFYLKYNANIHRGLYQIAEKATAAVEQVRDQVKELINAENREEIIFTKNATEGINLIAYTLGRKIIQKEDVVLSTIMEHHANFVPWQQVAIQKQADFHVLNINENYELVFENLKFEIRNLKLLTLTYISNVLGMINPVKEIIAKVKKINPEIIVVVDASQAGAHIPINVGDLNCDFLVLTGHKMFAETGVGVLYGKKKLLEQTPPFLYGGDMIKEVEIEKTMFAEIPSKFEAGTLNISGIISLGAAIDYIKNVGLDTIQKHEQGLIAYSLSNIEKIKDFKIYGPKDLQKRAGIISFSIEGIHPHDIAQLLADKNICVRAGHHCAMPLHTRLGIPATTRLSFSVYNTKEDIDKLVNRLEEIKMLFRNKKSFRLRDVQGASYRSDKPQYE